jgi:hypothetical protein
MAWNWCRGPNCRNMIETPFAHCSLDCERAEKRTGAPMEPERARPMNLREAETALSKERSAAATRQLHEAEEADLMIRAALGRGGNQTST